MRTATEIMNALPSEHRDTIMNICRIMYRSDKSRYKESVDFLDGYLFCLLKSDIISDPDEDELFEWCKSEKPRKYFKIGVEVK